jgi:hypothetical protein
MNDSFLGLFPNIRHCLSSLSPPAVIVVIIVTLLLWLAVFMFLSLIIIVVGLIFASSFITTIFFFGNILHQVVPEFVDAHPTSRYCRFRSVLEVWREEEEFSASKRVSADELLPQLRDALAAEKIAEV